MSSIWGNGLCRETRVAPPGGLEKFSGYCLPGSCLLHHRFLGVVYSEYCFPKSVFKLLLSERRVRNV